MPELLKRNQIFGYFLGAQIGSPSASQASLSPQLSLFLRGFSDRNSEGNRLKRLPSKHRETIYLLADFPFYFGEGDHVGEQIK